MQPQGFDEWLEAFPPTSVRLLAVEGAWPSLELTDRLSAWTPIIQRISRLAELNTLLFSAVETLARRATLTWPHWYARHVPMFADDQGAHALLINDERRRHVLRSLPGVVSRWLEDAVGHASYGAPPIFPALALETQVEQLALALDESDLRIALVLETQEHPHGLIRLARTADWLRLHARARVLVVVPAKYLGDADFDSIAYDALSIAGDTFVESACLPIRRPQQVLRIAIGRPHHASRAEQRLARALAGEPSLTALFAHNQRVESKRGTVFTVDLLWREASVVIEIDGWGTHGGREAFYADRHRDYELMLSGYHVLRITDDEIFNDLSLVIDKIRDVVAFIREARTTR